MNDVLLIKRVSLNNKETITKVSFILDNMDDGIIVNKVVDMLTDKVDIPLNDITIHYNGVTVLTKVETIPLIVKIFCGLSIPVYGIYELYDN